MTAAELGLLVWLGEDVPLGEDAGQPGVSAGARLRYRPSANLGVEVGWADSARGSELVVDGVGFLEDTNADLVVSPLVGLGVRGRETPSLLLEAGFGIDLTLFTVLDLRPEARVLWTEPDGAALRLGLAVSVHLPRRFDRDGDGVSDRQDRCVTQPEDADGYLDADGCPDPDDDGDGVLDADDACRGTREDRDGFLDADGCPEPDNDGDQLIDDRDACIGEPEDRDGFRDLDGCPDADNDEDRVPDALDACPNVAEDGDGWEDGDGCPDPDNDGDGVGDRFDRAPDAPENINFFEDADGVPDALPPLLVRVLGAQPRLKFRGAELTEAGAERAELIAAALAEYPEVRFRIVVTDPDPTRAQRRAEAVAAAVVRAGVAADRVEPGGAPGEAGVRLELAP